MWVLTIMAGDMTWALEQWLRGHISISSTRQREGANRNLSPAPVTHPLQKGRTSQSFSNRSINRAEVQTFEPRGLLQLSSLSLFPLSPDFIVSHQGAPLRASSLPK